MEREGEQRISESFYGLITCMLLACQSFCTCPTIEVTQGMSTPHASVGNIQMGHLRESFFLVLFFVWNSPVLELHGRNGERDCSMKLIENASLDIKQWQSDGWK